MTIRMTLTAVALASVALAGCGSTKTMTTPVVTTPAVTAPTVTAPVVTAPVVTAPTVAVTAPTVTVPSVGIAAPGVTTLGDPLLQDQGTQTLQSSGAYAAPTLVKSPEGMKDGDPFLQDQSTATLDSQYSDVDTIRMRDPVVSVADPDPLLQDQRSPNTGADTMMNDVMVMKEDKSDTMMSVDETMSADDAVMNACFQAGGQVVSWVGDSTGATQACRREDGLEYRLADAQYYQ